MTKRNDPKGVPDASGRPPGESVEDWFRRTFGPMPPPTPDMDVPDDGARRQGRNDALAALERTIPPVYGWSRFSAPELRERVPAAAIALGQSSSQEPRICVMGICRAGKTSLAVAMLRQWVGSSGRCAAFLPAHKLGMARIQHPAGHGEPEIVELALRTPLVLIDDLGCERDHVHNAPDVIFDRHAENRPTWVTTGLTRDQLVKRYGPGVVARVFERAKVIRIAAKGSEAQYSGAGLRQCDFEPRRRWPLTNDAAVPSRRDEPRWRPPHR